MKTLLSFLLLLLVQIGHAQPVNIECQYLNFRKVPKQILEMQDASMRENIIQQIQKPTPYLLIYSNGYSIFKKEEGGGSQVKLQGISSDIDEIFIDLSKRQLIAKEKIVDREFVVTENLSSHSWEIKSATKLINGYNSRKAILVSAQDTITAWFCSDIAVQSGPKGYWGLPGLIVELENTTETWKLNSLNILDKEVAIRPPTSKGKKIDRVAFEKLRAQKLRELGGNAEGGVKIIKL